MNDSIQQYILSKLQHRENESNFRSLKIVEGLIDFTSNDYLGFTRDKELRKRITGEIELQQSQINGSTGSRLLSGNSQYAEELERTLAGIHHAETALLFNSGFDANYGLLSTLPYKGDTIIYDELVHASIHDGIRQSKASSISFLHNSTQDLEEKLRQADGLKYVVIESVYSMDGDFAPLEEITNLCTRYNAGLIVDEAHATGVYGANGEGIASGKKLQGKILARVHTFGKAVGANGAMILCNQDLKKFLINYCRPFIFSTSLPLHSLAAIKCGYKYLSEAENRRQHLFFLIDDFRKKFQTTKYNLLPSNSPIQSVLIEGNEKVKFVADELQRYGFDVRPILYPTVSKGKERIRVCLHSFNSHEEVSSLVQTLNSI